MKLLIYITLILASVPAQGQTADEFFDEGEWAAARDAYSELVDADETDARGWFRLAVSARQLGDYDRARDALEQAGSLGYSPPRVGLERARVLVLLGDRAGAIDVLTGLAAAGFTAVNMISNDEILAGLSGDTAFDTLTAELAAIAYPCEHDSKFAAFDFWVGEWDVHDSQGNFVGNNVIHRAQHGCVLIENWTSATGGTGTSINYLDKTSDRWVQIWTDAGGSQIDIRGAMTEDGMRLVGTIHYVSNATTADFRGLWTPLPDGRVRQFFEQSNDGGETWSTWFEGFYSRRPLE